MMRDSRNGLTMRWDHRHAQMRDDKGATDEMYTCDVNKTRHTVREQMADILKLEAILVRYEQGT